MQVTGEEATYGAGAAAFAGALLGIARGYLSRRGKREDREANERVRLAALAAEEQSALAARAALEQSVHEERRSKAAEVAATAAMQTAIELGKFTALAGQLALEVRDGLRDVGRQVNELRDDIFEFTPRMEVQDGPLPRPPQQQSEDDTQPRSPRGVERRRIAAGGGEYNRRGSGGKED
jgi:hypothetical protein